MGDAVKDAEWRAGLQKVREAAQDTAPISGLTHCYYRYPARFSPTLAAAAIEAFSKPGDMVLDPFMGGGTAIIEALVRQRQAVGCDINSLAAFVAQVKTTILSSSDHNALTRWADEVVPSLSYSTVDESLDDVICEQRSRNLNLPFARPIKKIIGLAILTLDDLPGTRARNFARCALLNAGQWALNGRERRTPVHEFRHRLKRLVHEMLAGANEYARQVRRAHGRTALPTLITDSAASLSVHPPFREGEKADLVVTSPPYPGIHVLYHRWQVDGRRETPAPYWIAARADGAGNAFYNFADRREANYYRYFRQLRLTMKGIRRVLKGGSVVVQVVAFGDRKRQLPRYLRAMEDAGFEEVRGSGMHRRIWRSVPNRRWHATIKGDLPASREVVLIHRAV